MNRQWQQIYNVVANIPYGKVATYGQVAEAAGLPGHARMVGYALHGVGEETDLPWHRVVNAKGESSLDGISGGAQFQRALLRKEGVNFNTAGRIDLNRYRCQFESPDHVI